MPELSHSQGFISYYFLTSVRCPKFKMPFKKTSMFIYFQEADADNYADAEADEKVTGISKISNFKSKSDTKQI